jgi:cytochrome c553
MNAPLRTLALAAWTLASMVPLAVAQDTAELPTALCETCHGPDGASPLPDVPAIAGQNEPYLFESLKELQGEHGSSVVMKGVLHQRPTDELRRLARYFATRPYVRKPQTVDPARAERGREAYERLCQLCHHDEGRSTSYAEYPLLAGQDLSYMLREMGHILEGKRRVDAIKRDMLSLARREQIDDAIHFFASRKVAPGEVTTALTGEKRTRRSRFKSN